MQAPSPACRSHVAAAASALTAAMTRPGRKRCTCASTGGKSGLRRPFGHISNGDSGECIGRPRCGVRRRPPSMSASQRTLRGQDAGAGKPTKPAGQSEGHGQRGTRSPAAEGAEAKTGTMTRVSVALLSIAVGAFCAPIAAWAAPPAYCALYAREYASAKIDSPVTTDDVAALERLQDQAYFRCLNADNEPPFPETSAYFGASMGDIAGDTSGRHRRRRRERRRRAASRRRFDRRHNGEHDDGQRSRSRRPRQRDGELAAEEDRLVQGPLPEFVQREDGDGDHPRRRPEALPVGVVPTAGCRPSSPW